MIINACNYISKIDCRVIHVNKMYVHDYVVQLEKGPDYRQIIIFHNQLTRGKFDSDVPRDGHNAVVENVQNTDLAGLFTQKKEYLRKW